MSSPMARKQCDFTKLIMAGYEVELDEGNPQKFHVSFSGPKDTLYEGAMFRVHVELPEQYPFSSPGIGFEPNSIFHPNVDERSGSVCLDVINQTWTPMYSLVNVFDVFLPQLLTYPNPSDPLNADAAGILMKDRHAYDARVRQSVAESVRRHEARKSKRFEDSMASSRGSTQSPVTSRQDSRCSEASASVLGDADDAPMDGGELMLRVENEDEMDAEFE